MIDIYNSRRTNYIVCDFWYRKENGINDNEQLIMNEKPDGTIRVREISTKTIDERPYGNAWQIGSEKIHLETSDNVGNLRSDDKIKYRGKIYNVDTISQREIRKRNEFSNKPTYITDIYLRA